ncbi:MAG: hypothetical protein AB8G11_02340 [Saprospiraceae bacterium]
MKEVKKGFKHEIIRDRVYGNYLSLNENSLTERIAKDPFVKVHPCFVIKAWLLLRLIKEMTFLECTEKDKHYGEVMKHYERI